jgi:hypothetical protein
MLVLSGIVPVQALLQIGGFTHKIAIYKRAVKYIDNSFHEIKYRRF